MSDWHKKEVGEVASFFDVDINIGLKSNDVINRINKFGHFNDSSISKDLQGLLQIKVKRDGQVKKVSLTNLVPGDIVLLEEGNRVPANLRLFQVKALRVDQFKITGEPIAAEKNVFATKSEEKPPPKNIAFRGTFVKSGSGLGIVCEMPTKNGKQKKISNIFNRNLIKKGILVQNPQAVKKLKEIDMVLVDVSMVEQKITDLITKVQLGKNIQCKFIVKTEVAIKLKKDLLGSIIYNGKEVSEHVPKQFINMVQDAQFVTDISSTSLVKLLTGLNAFNIKYLYVTEGHRNPDVLRAANCSLLIGNYGRDDCVCLADLIAPKAGPLILESILHNKF